MDRKHCDRCDKVIDGSPTLKLDIPGALLGMERESRVRIEFTATPRSESGSLGTKLDLCGCCQGEILDVVSEQVGEPFDADRQNIHGSRRF